MAGRYGDTSSTEESLSGNSNDDKVYVAVGRDVQESKLTLLWAFENFSSNKICILHIHQPSKTIPLIGGNFPTSRLEQHDLREFQELERKIMRKILDDYVLICNQSEVLAEKLYIEMDDIGKGIVELVYHHGIKNLIMGAAAERYYSEDMEDLKSRKAMYVGHRVPSSCQIWFICKGYLIQKRERDTSPSSEVFGESSSTSHECNGRSEQLYELYEIPQTDENGCLDFADVLEGSSVDQLYNQLEMAMMEAERFKHEAFNESVKRGEAERKAVKAICRAKTLENLYSKELRRRKETEEAFEREKGQHQKTRNHRDEERLSGMDQRLLQDIQVRNFEARIQELEDERDNALKLADELSKRQVEEGTSGMGANQFFCTFSVSEIEEATNHFDQSLKIGQGGCGIIYKGLLRQTPVAVKVPNQLSLRGLAEFKQEVDILSNLRHPNLVTLIGACSEAFALIYEYLPNGSLQDRLSCKDNTYPLQWQDRVRIATELCSALIFLHSCTPQSVVHGDLKPGNILLDSNFTCKLSDFGISRAMALCPNSNATQCHKTDPKGTFHYMDPNFIATGELSPRSDIYSFGIILLQLLTGRPPFGIANDVECAIREENLTSLLDMSAGDWPLVPANQLARLALRCCSVDQRSRPNLASEVWKVLERVTTAYGSSSSSLDVPEPEPPSYFVCPITQEVMEDPYMAADGYTYEAEALRGWLESGHDRSPMTNLVLDHFNLIPNYALRSAIQEWLQQH